MVINDTSKPLTFASFISSKMNVLKARRPSTVESRITDLTRIPEFLPLFISLGSVHSSVLCHESGRISLEN